MKRESGLTLLEVVVALVLLSALAATSLPLLTESSRVLRAPTPEVGHFDLAGAVDRILAESEVPDDGAIAWPGHPERERIRVRRLRTEKADHAWLAFTWKDLVVARYEPIEESK